MKIRVRLGPVTITGTTPAAAAAILAILPRLAHELAATKPRPGTGRSKAR